MSGADGMILIQRMILEAHQRLNFHARSLQFEPSDTKSRSSSDGDHSDDSDDDRLSDLSW